MNTYLARFAEVHEASYFRCICFWETGQEKSTGQGKHCTETHICQMFSCFSGWILEFICFGIQSMLELLITMSQNHLWMQRQNFSLGMEAGRFTKNQLWPSIPLNQHFLCHFWHLLTSAQKYWFRRILGLATFRQLLWPKLSIYLCLDLSILLSIDLSIYLSF